MSKHEGRAQPTWGLAEIDRLPRWLVARNLELQDEIPLGFKFLDRGVW